MTTDLPALADFMTITPDERKQFAERGHILINGVLTQEEMQAYRNVINNAANKYNTEKRKLEDRDTYGKAFLQIMNLWALDELVARFTLAKRFGKIAADLLGVNNVRIYHDQALYKEPGGGFTPWHQDQYYWPVNTANTVTMWMPLIDITDEMGMLTFASGSHKFGFVQHMAISDESESALEQFIKNNGLEVNRAKQMNAGDATWHYGWTLHSAPANLSAHTMREVMTIIYVADGARIIAPQNKHQEDDRKKWLNDGKPGELINAVLNPLVL